MTTPPATVRSLFDWLVDGAPGAATPMAVIERLGMGLVEAGVPLSRMGASVRTLHPHIAGRTFSWTPGAEVKVHERPWSRLSDPGVHASPHLVVARTGTELRVGLEGATPTGYADLDELKAQGHTDYFGLPLKFMNGSVNSITFATRAKGGFTDEHVRALRQITRPLSRVAETLALMRTAANLLNAYVGRDAGDRILNGQVQRGDTENIHCVIWFSDLRGFTSLSGDRPPGEIIKVLNDFFDCQVPAIEANRGEILKFIGDGLLAIFPFDGEGGLAATGERAVSAAKSALASLEVLNGARASRGEQALRFGVALHVGDVAYGNIGGANRLDFTAIGPAVNLASRIEGLTSVLNRPVLLSADLARGISTASREVGTYELKGVAQAQLVFELTGK